MQDHKRTLTGAVKEKNGSHTKRAAQTVGQRERPKQHQIMFTSAVTAALPHDIHVAEPRLFPTPCPLPTPACSPPPPCAVHCPDWTPKQRLVCAASVSPKTLGCVPHLGISSAGGVSASVARNKVCVYVAHSSARTRLWWPFPIHSSNHMGPLQKDSVLAPHSESEAVHDRRHIAAELLRAFGKACTGAHHGPRRPLTVASRVGATSSLRR